MPLGRSASTSAFISAGVNRDHSVRSTCGGRVNRADQRRGTIGAHENRVQLPRQIDIGGVAAGAGDEAAVFAPAGKGVRDHRGFFASVMIGCRGIKRGVILSEARHSVRRCGTCWILLVAQHGRDTIVVTWEDLTRIAPTNGFTGMRRVIRPQRLHRIDDMTAAPTKGFRDTMLSIFDPAATPPRRCRDVLAATVPPRCHESTMRRWTKPPI